MQHFSSSPNATNWQIMMFFSLVSGPGDGFFSSAFQSRLIGNNLHNASMPECECQTSCISKCAPRAGVVDVAFPMYDNDVSPVVLTQSWHTAPPLQWKTSVLVGDIYILIGTFTQRESGQSNSRSTTIKKKKTWWFEDLQCLQWTIFVISGDNLSS